MNAQEITKALGGHWHGSYGTAKCPCHDDHEPSLSVRDGVDGEQRLCRIYIEHRIRLYCEIDPEHLAAARGDSFPRPQIYEARS